MTQKEKRETKKRLLIKIPNAILLRAMNDPDEKWKFSTVKFEMRGDDGAVGEFYIINDVECLLRFEERVKRLFPIHGREYKNRIGKKSYLWWKSKVHRLLHAFHASSMSKKEIRENFHTKNKLYRFIHYGQETA